ETAFLEMASPDRSGIGELVVTTLTNEFMPLIRYRIGDLAEEFATPFWKRYRVHGRVMDSLQNSSGSRVTVWQMDQCFEGIPGIAHYQITERRYGEFLVRYVADRDEADANAKQEIVTRLNCLLGLSGRVILEKTELLMPESSGKFRLCYPLNS